MTRACAMLSCLLTIALSVVVAADPVEMSGADLAASHRTLREAEQKVQSALHKRINVKWQGESLGGVLTNLAKQADVNLFIDSASMSDEGISLEEVQVELDLGETSIRTALRFLLPPAGLTWHSTGGVLEIIAKSAEKLESRPYDVSAIARILETHLPSRQELRQPNGVFRQRDMQQMFGMGMGMGMFNVPGDQNPTCDGPECLALFPQYQGGMAMAFGGGIMVRERHAQPEPGWKIGDSGSKTELALTNLIMKCTSGKWMDVDQEGGSIIRLPGRLVIRQTQQTHEEVQALLLGVERTLLRGPKSKSLDSRRQGYPYDEDANLIQKLSEAATIDAAEESLTNVLTQIAKSAGTRIWIDTSSLDDEGISPDTQVQLKLSGVPLSVILNCLLQPLSLEAVVEEGTLIVTTKSKADESEWFSTTIYSMGDFQGTPDDFIALIEQGTSGRWMEVDQEGGTAYALGSKLVIVRQAQSIQRQIAGLLEDLKKPADHVAPAHSEQGPAPLVLRLYPLYESATIAELTRTLPEMISPWDSKKGYVRSVGNCLAVLQPTEAHEKIAEIIGVLNSHAQQQRAIRQAPSQPVQPQPGAPTAPVPGAPGQPGPAAQPAAPAADRPPWQC